MSKLQPTHFPCEQARPELSQDIQRSENVIADLIDFGLSFKNFFTSGIFRSMYPLVGPGRPEKKSASQPSRMRWPGRFVWKYVGQNFIDDQICIYSGGIIFVQYIVYRT